MGIRSVTQLGSAGRVGMLGVGTAGILGRSAPAVALAAVAVVALAEPEPVGFVTDAPFVARTSVSPDAFVGEELAVAPTAAPGCWTASLTTIARSAGPSAAWRTPAAPPATVMVSAAVEIAAAALVSVPNPASFAIDPARNAGIV